MVHNTRAEEGTVSDADAVDGGDPAVVLDRAQPAPFVAGIKTVRLELFLKNFPAF